MSLLFHSFPLLSFSRHVYAAFDRDLADKDFYSLDNMFLLKLIAYIEI